MEHESKKPLTRRAIKRKERFAKYRMEKKAQRQLVKNNVEQPQAQSHPQPKQQQQSKKPPPKQVVVGEQQQQQQQHQIGNDTNMQAHDTSTAQNLTQGCVEWADHQPNVIVVQVK